MTFRGKDIFKLNTQTSHVKASQEFSWREAARWAGFTDYRQFEAMPGEEQSTVVAHFLTVKQLEAVIAMDRIKRQKRAAKRSKS